MKKMVKAFLSVSLRIAISLFLLLWLFSRADISEILHSFRLIHAKVWAVAFVLYLLSQICSSLRWFVLSSALHFKGKFATYLKYYFVGMFFNMFLPSAIGGDVLKVFFLSRGGNSKLRASYSILSDRLFGLWAMFILGSCALYLAPRVLPGKFRAILVLIAVSMTFAAVFMPAFRRMVQTVFPALAIPLESAMAFWQQPGSLFSALTLSLILQFLGMYIVYLLGRGLGIPCRVEFYFAAFPLVAVLTILPISLSGLGIREGGFVYFLGLKGVLPEKAIALSLGFFAVQASAALIGGICYLLGVHRETIGDA